MSKVLLYESNKSTLYKEIYKDSGNSIVLKVLNDTIPNPLNVIHFNNEFEISKRVDNPAIRKAYGVDKINNKHVIKLEYFEGETLGKCFLNNNKCDLATFLKIAIKIVEGLEILHHNNIIHKDINKNNILVDYENEQVKIIDFGIASSLDLRIQNEDHPNLLEGTLEYISPEQTGRLNSVVDYRTDFYSLGITFYELLTGKLPFNYENPLELLHSHIARSPLSIENKEIHFDNAKNKLPKAVSDIVMKLIAKNVEDRYQSAHGLKCDLQFVLDKLTTKGFVEDFKLGSKDSPQKLQLSTKLYGRNKELKILKQCLQRVVSKNVMIPPEVVMISGYSGVGKTELAEALRLAISKQKGRLIIGKCDQLSQKKPYSALGQALSNFIAPLLSEEEEKLKQWRSKILTELDGAGGVLQDFIPNLQVLIGEQPALPMLGAAEAHNRLNYAFQCFFEAIISKDQPLILFIDDMHWANLATIDIIKRLVTKTSLQGLLFVGTYRHQEVHPTHPLTLSIRDLKASKVNLTTIELNNLNKENVEHMIENMFGERNNELGTLAEIIMNKTKGNPFFVNQFIRTIYEDKLLGKDIITHKWKWDIEAIKDLSITDNVIDLLSSKIKVLSTELQKLLKLASCIGNSFDIETLSIVAKVPEKEVINSCWEAINEGLIVPDNGANYNNWLLSLGNNKGNRKLKFVHDKVRDTLYNDIVEEEKVKIHLMVGRLLLKDLTEGYQGEFIFEVLHHLNKGVSLIVTAEEKLLIAQLNESAGIKAKKSGAYESSFHLLMQGIDLLPKNCWKKHYKLSLSLHSEITETAFLMGDFLVMNKGIDQVINNAENVLDTIKVYDNKIIALISQNKFPETINTGLEILELLDEYFPKKPKKIHIGGALLKTKIALSGKKIESYLDLPIMTDSYKIAAMGILQRMIPAAFMSGSNLFPLIVFRLVNISLKYGNNPISAFGYACYAITCCGVLGEINNGYRFGSLSLKLADKFDNDQVKAKVGFVYNCFVKHWKDPLTDAVSPLLETYKLGLKTGAIVDGVWAAFYQFIWAFNSGKILPELSKELKDFHEVFKSRDAGAFQMNNLLRQVVLNLEDEQISHPHLLNRDFYNEEVMLEIHKQASDKSAVCIYFLNKIQMCYHFGEYQLAHNNVTAFKNYAEAVTGLAFVPIFNFYESLIILALLKGQNNHPQKTKLQRVVSKNQSKMKKWAKHAPKNYKHKYLLVEAEKSSLYNKNIRARNLYEEATTSVGNEHFINEKALICELAGRFHNSNKNKFLAEIYLQKAVQLYLSWGSKRKRKQLLEEFPELLSVNNPLEITTDNNRLRNDSTRKGTSELDIISLMKASTSISGEIVLNQLLEMLIKIVIENAGAQKGLLILNRNNKLYIEAAGEIGKPNMTLEDRILVNEEKVPLSILNYTFRTSEPVVLKDGLDDLRFNKDKCILKKKPKSILCYPILDKGKRVGLIYLENNLINNAFTADRLELLKLLSGQIAVSIDNAMLYENLEAKVVERTERIKKQNELIVNQNNDLVSSIRYAQRIQEAILPKDCLLSNYFSDFFIMLLPKDIVSGDFFWFSKRNDLLVLAAADCTGHGVPGAFMSMIGSALLNKIVVEDNVLEPDQILDKLHNEIVKSLKQKGASDDSRDGMDIALIVWDQKKQLLSFSGAYNPLYIVSNNELSIIEAERRPVGYFPYKSKPFSKHIVRLNKGDTIFLFSDGYADQFGGGTSKKIGRKQFQEILTGIANSSSDEQKKVLLDRFTKWKDQEEQIDDVLIIGLKV